VSAGGVFLLKIADLRGARLRVVEEPFVVIEEPFVVASELLDTLLLLLVARTERGILLLLVARTERGILLLLLLLCIKSTKCGKLTHAAKLNSVSRSRKICRRVFQKKQSRFFRRPIDFKTCSSVDAV
jgi:hypothetical protein